MDMLVSILKHINRFGDWPLLNRCDYYASLFGYWRLLKVHWQYLCSISWMG